jgi:hypothetical protein
MELIAVGLIAVVLVLLPYVVAEVGGAIDRWGSE